LQKIEAEILTKSDPNFGVADSIDLKCRVQDIIVTMNPTCLCIENATQDKQVSNYLQNHGCPVRQRQAILMPKRCIANIKQL
jgi:hypothetical protein